MQNSAPHSLAINNQVEPTASSNSEIKFSVTKTNSILKAIVISILVFVLSIILLNSNAQTIVTFNTAGTTSWTCPAFVTSIKVEAWGGGGAGGGSNQTRTGGGGGGGGAYAFNNTIAVTPGTVYTITVGAGGIGSTSIGAGGGTSVFGSSLSAFGGVGGSTPAFAGSAAGGSGATGGTGGTYLAGGSGANSTYINTSTYTSGAGGGGAGSSAAGSAAIGTTAGIGGTGGGGNGGVGYTAFSGSLNGINGNTLGAGGGGAIRNNTAGSRNGGNGGNGQVRVTYTNPPCNLPLAQPTGLTLSPFVNYINGSFTASVSASGYLVVMTTTATAPSSPVNGTSYTVGSAALGGTIISTSPANAFNATGLASGVQYWFWIYAYNAPTACTGVITYRTATPLTGSATTTICAPLTNTAIITSTAGGSYNSGTNTWSFNWSALTWSLGRLPIPCDNVVLTVNRTGATADENITVILDVNFSVRNFNMSNISNTARRIVFATSGNVTGTISGNLVIECPGVGVSNRFNRTVFSNSLITTITGDVTLGRVVALTASNEGHSGIGSTGTIPNQMFNMWGNMTFNPRGYTTDEWAVFNFDKAGTQYVYNLTRPLNTDTIYPVLFEDLRVGTNNATTLIFRGTMFDNYMENVGRAGITIGVNSTLDLPANYALNNIAGGTASFLKMLAGARLRLGGDRSINDIYGNAHGVAGSNFPGGLNNPAGFLNSTSTIEYYGNNTITQTIFNGITYENLLANNAVASDLVAPIFSPSTPHAQKITTGALTVNTSFNIRGFADVSLGTLGSSTRPVTCNGPLNILTDGGLFCNANVVSGTGAFTSNSLSLLGMGHAQGVTPSGSAIGNIQMTGGRTYNTNGNYLYNGIVNQMTGVGLPTIVNDLTIDNPLTVTIANNQLVNGIHHLKQGTFDIGTTKITINGAGVITAATGKMKADVGIVEMKGNTGTAQNLSGNWFVNKTISILTNANTKGILVAPTPADTLLISTALDYGAVTGSDITTNDNLTLLSRFTGTANFGNSTGNTITGKVNIERYLTARSSWRFLATPIQAGTSPKVSQAWRENNNAFTATGYGTRITGPVGPFGAAGTLDDFTQRVSMKSYNSANNTYTDMTNANTTNIANAKGYYVFIRGDRANGAVAGLSGITNLRIKGDVLTGNQVFTIPARAGSSAGFESIGNPYPSRVLMSNVTKAGSTVNAFTTWNPNSAGVYNVGAFETYTWNGTDYVKPGGVIKNFIESGEAIFMQNNSTTTASTVTFKEGDKASGSANVSRPGVTTPTLEINMYAQNIDGSMYLADGVKLNYNNAFSAGIDNLDVRKIGNVYDNISIKNGTVNLIVERRPDIVAVDTIALNITGMRLANYRLDVDPSVLSYPNLEATLVDNFLQTRTDVSFTAVTSIDFTITADAASRAVNRFMIVFREVSGTTFETIVAARNSNKTVNINWTIQNEIAVTNYTIEQSTDGVNFNAIGTQAAIANNGTSPSYTFTDLNASTAKNWYRVKANIGTSSAKYTAIAMVNELTIAGADIVTTGTIGIYPNPVIDGRINLKLYNQAFGDYSVMISNTNGQIINRSKIKVQTNAVLQTINVGAATTGLYYATIIDTKGKKTTITFLVK